MRPSSLTERLYRIHSLGLSLPPISGGDGTETPAEPPVPATPTPTPMVTPTPTPSPPDLGKLVADAVAKHGDQTSALKSLVADNYALRDDLKTARAKLPKDGTRVIEGDDLKHFDAYREIGTPSDIRKTKEERDALAAENATFKAEKLHGQAASLSGMNPHVLHRLATQDKVEVVILDAKDKAGKDVRVAHVKGEGDKTTPLSDYAEKNWAEFLPSLKPSGAKTTETRPNATPSRTEFNPLLGAHQTPETPAPMDAKAKHLARVAAAF